MLLFYEMRLLLLLQGVLYPLVEGEAPLALLTDGHGQFIVDEPMDGIYKFSSALKGESNFWRFEFSVGLRYLTVMH